MDRVLALDFDGVLSDSAAESFVVAVESYVALDPASRLAAARDELAAGALERARVVSHPLYAGFLEAMPLGNRAEDYGVVLRSLEQGVPLPDQQAYDRLRAEVGPAFLDDFHRRFYAERRALASQRPEAWLGLMSAYPRILPVLERRQRDAALFVATAKDAESVRRLLTRYGVRDLFPDDRILDKETGVSKRSHMEAIRGALGVAADRITFVDDKVNHLESVADLGVRCVLAAWGYNGPREHRRARERGFEVCELARAEAVLFDPEPGGARENGLGAR